MTKAWRGGLMWVLAAFGLVQAQTPIETVLHSFQPYPPKGANPTVGVFRDAAGNLYGTTKFGGAANFGVIYKVDSAGHETVLYSFTGGADGWLPESGVTLDPAGNLYGTTLFGGTGGYGTVYKLDTAGQLTVLYSFTGGSDGGSPAAGVIRDAAGNLYGTTLYYGAFSWGVVYKLDTAGNYTVLHNFMAGIDGGNPSTGVIRDPAGNLFGTSSGLQGRGVIFKLDTAGHFTVLHSFTGEADGQVPFGGLSRGAEGNLYGTMLYGGAAGAGVVFKLETSGHLTVLHSFSGGADGGSPYGGVMLDSGSLYGTASGGGAAGAGVVYKIDDAGRETVLYSFSGGADGSQPEAGVILDAEGNIYGTTYGGGAGNSQPAPGLVYKLNLAGQEIAYPFPPAADGGSPSAGVIRDAAGNLYGTTQEGGITNQANPSGCGVVYRLDTTGRETVLYSFTCGADGANPYAGVTLDPAGNLYGTTLGGGTANWGVVYKVDTAGRETVLHSFSGDADGGWPWSGVVRDAAGNLYGTTWGGGNHPTTCAPIGCGVVYKIDPAGEETVLYSFSGTDGANPAAGVSFDSAGNIYGTTANGGDTGSTCGGCAGLVYKLDPNGQETVLYNFAGGTDGSYSGAGVVLDPAGNIYGTTEFGGVSGNGAVFEVDTAGQETLLYSFTGGADGSQPRAGLIRDAAGNLFGTSLGAVYKLDTAGQFTVLYSFTGGAGGSYCQGGVVPDDAGNLYGTAGYGGNVSDSGVVFKLALR